MKIPLEILRSHLESANHSIGHAMAHAAQGYTLEVEKDLSLAMASLEAAQRMFSIQTALKTHKPRKGTQKWKQT